MKRKTKRCAAIGFVLIAITVLIGLIFIAPNQINTFSIPIISSPIVTITTETEPYVTSNSKITATPNSTTESIPAVDSTKTVAPTNPSDISAKNPQVIMQITIETERKTRTYDVMPDAKEETLKRDLGHLPTSAMPGQEGLCVIMGHRDAQFSILKYCEIGNQITLRSEKVSYVYSVYDIKIVENDSALHFCSLNGANLALVTCYPFRYTGHAPKKFVLYARIMV